MSSPVARAVIGCAIHVHREVGPGLFERVYEKCLAHELARRGLDFIQQVPLSLAYRDVVIPCAYRADMIVEREVLIEIKTVDRILPVHHAQVLTYLRLSGVHQGLLINFNVPRLTDGLKSFLMT